MSKHSSLGMIETGASHHMLNEKSLFVSRSLKENEDSSVYLRLAGRNSTLPIKGFGTYSQANLLGQKKIFKNLLYIPDLTHNLFAGGRLVRAGVKTELLNDPPL